MVLVVGCGSDKVTPVDRPTVTVSAGQVWALASTCRADWSAEATQEKVATFEIDRDAVTCGEWEACVKGGGCKSRRSDECLDGVMEVGLVGANSFCQWRGRRLATWVEWARAARGDSRDLVRDSAKSCSEFAHNDERLTRCAYKGPTGMLFALTMRWHGEWTSDQDCVEVDGRSDGMRLLVTVGLGEAGLTRAAASRAPFRCVKN
jgi:hypothetical protein